MTDDALDVRIGCICPGNPHADDGDVVHLRAKLGLAAGLAIQKLVVDANRSAGSDAAEITGVLGEAYLLHGVESWSLLDEQSQPVPVTHDTIRSKLLDDFSVAAPIADVADDLYMGPVLLPLVVKASKSLPRSQTDGSTSANRTGRSSRRKRSKPSSTSSSATDDIGTTSLLHAGDSSSSQS